MRTERRISMARDGVAREHSESTLSELVELLMHRANALGSRRKQLERVLASRFPLHASETEIDHSFSPGESSLSGAMLRRAMSEHRTCYGIRPALGRYIFEKVSVHSRTLETGAGVSTLVFALAGSHHVAVTPSRQEREQIEACATRLGVDLSRVTFVLERSEDYLPGCALRDLDLVLIDGKHAYPWPTVDWFYTADRLKRGGLMVLDDTDLFAVEALQRFMARDRRWRSARRWHRACAFVKEVDSVHEVAWHMQPESGRLVRRVEKAIRALVPSVPWSARDEPVGK